MSLPDRSPARDLAVDGDRAYLVLGHDLQNFAVVDVSNPASPNIMGFVWGDLAPVLSGIDAVDGLVYIAAEADGLLILQPNGAAPPSLLSQLNLDTWVLGVIVRGDRAYVGAEELIALVNVSNSRAPSRIMTVPIMGFSSDLDIENDTLVAAQGVPFAFEGSEGGVGIYDISSPNTIEFVSDRIFGSPEDPQFIDGISIRNKYVYVGAEFVPASDIEIGYDGGIKILDIIRPNNPQLDAITWPFETTVADTYAYEGYVYTAEGNKGIRVYRHGELLPRGEFVPPTATPANTPTPTLTPTNTIPSIVRDTATPTTRPASTATPTPTRTNTPVRIPTSTPTRAATSTQTPTPTATTPLGPAKVTLTRSIDPPEYTAGQSGTVTLTASVEAGFTLSALTVEETVPAGLIPENISNSGQYNAGTLVIRWFILGQPSGPLTYTVTPAADAGDDYAFSGIASYLEEFQEVPVAIGGQTVWQESVCIPQAVDTDGNYEISTTELLVAASQWTSGASSPTTSELLIAASFWTSGGAYHCDDEGNYVAGAAPGKVAALRAADIAGQTGAGQAPDSAAQPAQAATAVRAFLDECTPGQTGTASITITTTELLTAIAVDEVVPEGWTVTNISNNGVFAEATRTIRWFLLPGVDTVLSYEVTPNDTSDEFSGTLTYIFSGAEEIVTIGGDVACGAPVPEATATPVPIIQNPRTDINQDGIVDYEDLLLLMEDWHRVSGN